MSDMDCSLGDTRTIDWLLDDLDERLACGSHELKCKAYSSGTTRSEMNRLAAKASGLDLVKDWLRAYR